MAKLWNRRFGASALFYSIPVFLCFFVFLIFAHTVGIFYDTDQKQNLYEKEQLLCRGDPLCFVPLRTRRVWDERDFLVIFGFPSLDLDKRRWRRHLQRMTCWQFPEVATRNNDYTGAMLVLYLLARHSSHGFVLSDKLVEEGMQWQDIIVHPMNEGRPSTNKIVHDTGYWGLEAEIGSSRKTFFWFQFALRQFPRAPFIAKGDDDTFLSVPQYLADLRRLPRQRTYWGRYIYKNMTINEKGDKVTVGYMLGYCTTLARDAAERLVSYKPVQRLALLPFNEKTKPEFIAMNMNYEDVMIGRVLKEVGFAVIYFLDDAIRFHVYTNQSVTEMVVATHKPEEHQYYAYMNLLMFREKKPNATRIIKSGPNFYWMRSPA